MTSARLSSLIRLRARRRTAGLLRETLGKIPGVRFSLPHDPYGARKDGGAVGPMGSEVDKARALIEELERGASDPTRVASSVQMGGERAPIRDSFAALVARDLENLETFSRRAARMEDAAEREQDQAIRADVDKALTDLAIEAEVDPAKREELQGMIETYRPMLSPSRYRQLTNQATRANQTTNIETWRDLYDRSHFEPAKVREESRQAFEQGLISGAEYKEMIKRTQAPPIVRQMKSVLRGKLKPPADSSEAEREEYFQSLEDFDSFVEERGDGLEPKELNTFIQERIKQAKATLAGKARREAQKMRYLSVPRETADIDQIEGAWQKTIEAHKAGEIDVKEFTAQYKLYKHHMKMLSDEAEGRGEKVKAPRPAPQQSNAGVLDNIPQAAQQMLDQGGQIPGTEVKGSEMVTAPNTAEQMPNSFLGAADQMLQSGAQIPPGLIETIQKAVSGFALNKEAGGGAD